MSSITSVNKLITVGNSMGAPLATLAGIQSCLVSKEVAGVITTGMPRVANGPLTDFIFSKLKKGLSTVGFAYGRDPVPHVPPRFFGYKSTQAKLFHIKILLELDTLDQEAQNTNTNRYMDTDYGAYVHYSKVYVNSESNYDGDKQFSSAVGSYNLGDHSEYWKGAGAQSCGSYADPLLKLTSAAELFFI